MAPRPTPNQSQSRLKIDVGQKKKNFFRKRARAPRVVGIQVCAVDEHQQVIMNEFIFCFWKVLRRLRGRKKKKRENPRFWILDSGRGGASISRICLASRRRRKASRPR